MIAADDILQEVWIKAFRSLSVPKPQDIRSFDAWLTTIADRALINAIRLQTCDKRGGLHKIDCYAVVRARSFSQLFNLAIARTATPSSEAAVSEAVNAVQIALASLPDSSRRAIWLRYVEGHSREQIADLMSKTQGAVDDLLFRGLQLLRRRLGHARLFFSDAPSEDEPDSQVS